MRKVGLPSRLTVIGVVFGVVVAAGAVFATPAYAATITVSTTADGDASGACADGSVTTLPAPPVSLRTALCVAGNLGGAQVVEVPAGDYTLTEGALVVGTAAGASVVVSGPSTGTARLIGNGSTQLLTVDPDLVGDVAVTVEDLTFQGGRDSLYGGGAIIAGSAGAGAGDELTVRRSTFVDNRSTAAAAPGGAIQFMGGSLTIEDSTFTGNDSGTSDGGAVFYLAMSATGEALDITGSTFTGNTAHAAAGVAAGGGAVAYSVDAGASASVTISGSTFANNTVTTTDASPTRGGAIRQQGGTATVTENAFTGNSAGAGAAIDATGGRLDAHFNLVAGNTGTAVSTAGTTADLTRNWWGCATGTGTAGCDTVATSGATAPHLTLTGSASPSAVAAGGSATLSVSLRTDSGGGAVAASDLSAFTGRAVAWTGATPAGSSVGSSSTFAAGIATTTYTAGPAGGPGGATATFHSANVPIAVAVSQPPVFAAYPSEVTLTAGSAMPTLTLTATGSPTPAIIMTGSLPDGLTFTPSPGGATVTGTPTGAPVQAGAPLSSTVTFSALNGVGTPAVATVTFVVNDRPAITSAGSAIAQAGAPFTFTVTATGRPTPGLAVAPLPAGLSFVDNGDGTGTLSGTPSAALSGENMLTISAQNTSGTAVQSFLLTVRSAPAFTSPDTATFAVGTAGTFVPTVGSAYPAAVTIVSSGTLPAGIVFTPGAAGSAQFSGTPAAGAGGTYDVQLTATNAAGSTTQDLTLTVTEAPVVTDDPDDVSVRVGAGVTLTAAARGFPAPTVQWQRFDGASWVDVAGATSSTLTFTAALADDGARFRAVFTNSASAATSAAATVVVSAAPAIAPVAPVTVLPGAPRSIELAVTGHPSPVLSAVGLPAWLTLTDNHDGTATLSGTPGVGDVAATDVVVQATNSAGTALTTVSITVALDVALPGTVPAGDGPLGGVPGAVVPGQVVTVSGDGYLPGASIAIGMYSTPTSLGSATADASGAFSAAVTVPFTAVLGSHTLAATGVSAAGDVRTLVAAVNVTAASGGSGGSVPGASGSGALGATGGTVPWWAVVSGLLAIALGAALAVRSRRAR